jgi:hypothetical protein
LEYSVREIVGQLRFLVDRTRWDVKTAVSKISSFQSLPTEFIGKSIARVVAYLQNHADLGITLRKGDGTLKLCCSSDASHLPERDAKPRVGYEIRLQEEAASVIARSNKIGFVATSSFQAELVGVSELSRHLVWTRGLLSDMKVDSFYGQDLSVVMELDNQGVIDCIMGEQINFKSKHLTAKIMEVREFKDDGIFVPIKINGTNITSDTLTKPLAKKPFWNHTTKLMDLRDEEGVEAFLADGGVLNMSAANAK